MSSQSHPSNITLRIKEWGVWGDGIGYHQGKKVYVPYSCPGDQVHVALSRETQDSYSGALISVLTPSPIRTRPACQHFSECGGCHLQQVTPQAYQDFKKSLVQQALSSLPAANPSGFSFISSGPASRRRVIFHYTITNGQIEIGFYARKTHRIVSLSACPVMVPALYSFLCILKKILQRFSITQAVGRCHATALPNGIDMLLESDRPLPKEDKDHLWSLAQNYPVCRISYKVAPLHQHSPKKKEHEIPPAILYDQGTAHIVFSDTKVALPAGAFLQPTLQGQILLSRLVREYLATSLHCADLFAGCGMYSFALAGHAHNVDAFEGDATMVDAITRATPTKHHTTRIRAYTRNLFSSPLTVSELNCYDGLVINPPRSGAFAQAKLLARSTIPHIVMVSCNLSTFRRDAQVLLQGGYQLDHVTALDQFHWNIHMELVAYFHRQP